MPEIKRKKTVRSLFSQIEGSLIIEKLPGYFLIVCLLVVSFYMIYLLIPILAPIFVGAVLAVAFFPVFSSLNNLFRGRSRLASFISCLFVLFMIVAPLTMFVFLVAGEAVATYKLIDFRVSSGEFDKYLQWEDGGIFYDWLEAFKVRVAPVYDVEKFDVKNTIVNTALSLSSNLKSYVFTIAEKSTSFLLSLFVMFFSMYYFFKDGNKLVEKIGHISPLPKAYESELFAKLASMIKAIIFGVFLTAILQGFVGGVGFAIVGIPSPVFWGAVMAFLSLLPVVGTGFVWGPAAVILVVTGYYGAALFILLWGVLLVGTIDNIARTYLIGSKARTYPLMTFIVILGGVLSLGFKGVIVGPLVLVLLMSFLHIYEAEYSKVLKR